MNKQEFEKRVGFEVPEKEYSIIEKVYTWHPAINNVGGKDQIADLYKSCGMAVIVNMEETADLMIELDREKARIRKKLSDLEKRIEKVEHGDLTEEMCRKDASSLFEKSNSEEEWKLSIAFLEEKYGKETADMVAEGY